jgi:alpha-amylase
MKVSTTTYQDYEEWLNKSKMDNLIWIHNNKATGTTSVLYTDNDDIARRNGYNGNPGLVVYINNSSSWMKDGYLPGNAQIKDFTGNSVGFRQLKETNG